MVKSLGKLDRYRWSGHSVLVGRRRRTWQDRGEILSHFGLKKREAVRRYREFIEDGFNMGRREDLTGGGLRRSAGGWEGVFELRRTEEYWRGDEYWLAAILKQDQPLTLFSGVRAEFSPVFTSLNFLLRTRKGISHWNSRSDLGRIWSI